ncbi:conserved hypothetical protein [Ricinus communis]|uniref:Uncharacterized protein n=1 Tax=Ricinus communis TaxID=3988 RepID=B9SDH0_RICCO|nr:conserved hypothetical protein [Ricinus communis]
MVTGTFVLPQPPKENFVMGPGRVISCKEAFNGKFSGTNQNQEGFLGATSGKIGGRFREK